MDIRQDKITVSAFHCLHGCMHKEEFHLSPPRPLNKDGGSFIIFRSFYIWVRRKISQSIEAVLNLIGLF